MSQSLLPLPEPAPTIRRGRPPGARNRRSLDLARYVEAMFGGMTPGQQAAELGLVKPADLKRAKAQAKALGIPDHGLGPLALAMAVKARQLASAIGCETKEAWLLLQRERAELMPYIHQRQAPMSEAAGKAPATVFLVPEGEADPQPLADLTPDPDDIEFIEELDEAEGEVT